ncbi:MAG: histone deacetylase [Puia sp.]|nr:histone deacetylase [Puia sp.]
MEAQPSPDDFADYSEEEDKKSPEVVPLKSTLSVQNTSLEVGIAFDERMLLHKCFSKRKSERPERLLAAMGSLIADGIYHKCLPIPVREAPEEAILLAHSKSHLESLKSIPYDSASHALLPEGVNTSRFFYGTYENLHTYTAAVVSAGCVTSAVDSMFAAGSEMVSAFCVNRPPGHHAGRDSVAGYCFLNNVAVGVRYAQKKYGLGKVAIIDWDAHHGNETQDIFNEDGTVLYVTMQRYEDGNFYPDSGGFEEVGKGRGEGLMVNIPWNTEAHYKKLAQISDPDYMLTFREIVLPILAEFAPEAIFVSSGFDAMRGDKVGRMQLSPWVYYWMTRQLQKINPRLLLVLEGGYNLKMLPQGIEHCIKALLGIPVETPAGMEKAAPSEFARKSVERVKKVQSRYWRCLKDHAAKKVSLSIADK